MRKVHREISATAAGINLDDHRRCGVSRRLIAKMLLCERYVPRLLKRKRCSWKRIVHYTRRKMRLGKLRKFC